MIPICKIYSFEERYAKKRGKPKEVSLLQRIAGMYFIIGAFLGAFSILGFPVIGNVGAMLAFGFLLAGMQTYLIGWIVHAAYFHGRKRNVPSGPERSRFTVSSGWR